MSQNFLLLCAMVIVFAAGCATVEAPLQAVEAPVSREAQKQAQQQALKPEQKIFKRKIGIGRFTNESRYGKSLLRDGELDPLGKQVADMLMSRLVQSGKFIVLERNDLGRLEREQAIIAGQTGQKKSVINVDRAGSDDNNVKSQIEFGSNAYKEFNLLGADALIIGSLTEFSRKTVGKSGFLSGTKKQVAQAKVEVRLSDPLTGHAFFSATGAGSADSESGTVAGFGSKAGYDGSLNDKAIASAISDLIGDLIGNLESRPWRAGILKIEGDRLYISGGKYQGLALGDELSLMKKSEAVKSDTGFNIQLPPTQLGKVRVIGFFGESETNEGSVVEIVSGQLDGSQDIYVSE